MRIPTSETNDTLDAASLPPTEGTELNYRTRPDVETEIRFTHDALKFAVGVSVVAAIGDTGYGPFPTAPLTGRGTIHRPLRGSH